MGGYYPDQDLVVGQLDDTPIGPNTISYQFEKAIRAAKLPPIRPHDLRHTHATLRLEGRHPFPDRAGAAGARQRLHHVGHVLPRRPHMQAAAARQVAALVAAAPPVERSLDFCDQPCDHWAR